MGFEDGDLNAPMPFGLDRHGYPFGWFSKEDMIEYERLLEKLSLQKEKEKEKERLLEKLSLQKEKEKERPLRIAEIGVYQGRSTSISAKFADQVYAVDIWLGDGRNNMPSGPVLRSLFIDNMHKLRLLHKIHILEFPSVTSSEVIPNNYLDLVFIDGNHEASYVMADIASWMPKIRKGGIICGHDYHEGLPGVIQAWDQFFPVQQKTIGGSVVSVVLD